MVDKVVSTDNLSYLSTEDLKKKVLELTTHRDTDSLSKKVTFYRTELEPIVEELSKRNPFPDADKQVELVLGVWTPIWSTIPFQDTLPGRIREQSYQIFHDDGYYANIARYAPGQKFSLLQKLSSLLLAYDLMIIQKYEVRDGKWFIQNVVIKQAFKRRGNFLGADDAGNWFTTVVNTIKESSENADLLQAPALEGVDKSTAKKFEKTFLATPQLEHLYIDRDFRVVKSQREAKQRPSYTIAVRQR